MSKLKRAVKPKFSTKEIDLKLIVADDEQPRYIFDETALMELSDLSMFTDC